MNQTATRSNVRFTKISPAVRRMLPGAGSTGIFTLQQRIQSPRNQLCRTLRKTLERKSPRCIYTNTAVYAKPSLSGWITLSPFVFHQEHAVRILLLAH